VSPRQLHAPLLVALGLAGCTGPSNDRSNDSAKGAGVPSNGTTKMARERTRETPCAPLRLDPLRGAAGSYLGNGKLRVERDLADWLANTSGPALLGEFAAFEFGMSQAEVEAISPTMLLWSWVEHEHAGRVSYKATFGHLTPAHKGRFDQLTLGMMAFADQTGAEKLEEAWEPAVARAWGPPLEIHHRLANGELGHGDRFWLNQKTCVRATNQWRLLTIEPYVPLEVYVGAGPGLMDLETPRRFLGSSSSEIKASYSDRISFPNSRAAFGMPGKVLELRFDNIEYSTQGLVIKLFLDQDVVTKVAFAVPHDGSEVERARVDRILAAKFGAPRAATIQREPYQLFGGEPLAVVSHRDNGATVVIVPAKPTTLNATTVGFGF